MYFLMYAGFFILCAKMRKISLYTDGRSWSSLINKLFSLWYVTFEVQLFPHIRTYNAKACNSSLEEGCVRGRKSFAVFSVML